MFALSNKVSNVELENGSLKKLLNENKVHTLHAEILDIENKKGEIRSQQATFKQEIETHINSWAQVVEGKDVSSPLAAIEEVVQTKIVKERTKRARELNLKVRGLPLPHSSPNPKEVKAIFLWDALDLLDMALNIDWLGSNSTLFICFRTLLQPLKIKWKLFSLRNKIFLDENLTQYQVVELKRFRKQIMAARQAGKRAIIRDLKAVIWDYFPPGWQPRPGASKWRTKRERH